MSYNAVLFDDTTTTAPSPRFGGSFSTTQLQLRKCAMTFLSLHASEGDFLRPSPLSTLRREHLNDNQPASTLILYLSLSIYLPIYLYSQPAIRHSSSLLVFKTRRLILGGSVRQQSLQYRSTSRFTALLLLGSPFSLLVTTTGHHHL